MDFDAWIAFAIASAVLVAIPGPTVMLVVGCALGQGKRSVLATAPGVLLGDVVAMTASMLGVGAVLAASASLFTAVKLAGAVYLVWMGVRMWRDSPRLAQARAVRGRRSAGRMFRESFLVTVLNPKALVFFVAFVPQFVDPTRPVGPQFAILIATFTLLGFVNAIAWGVAAGEMRARLSRPGALRTVTRTGGGLLIGAGALTAFAARG